MKSTLLCLLVLLAMSLTLVSCKQETDKRFALRFATPPPSVDHSTPDRLVKSVWNYSAWLLTLDADSAFLQPFLSDRARKAVLASMANQAQENTKSIEKYEILKVNSESDSRATVLTWEGKDSALYVLTNPGTGWQVDDRQQKCWNCSGTGQETDFEAWKSNSYSSKVPKKECTKCEGSGRISSYYHAK